MHRDEFPCPTDGLPGSPVGVQRPRPPQYFMGGIRVPYIAPWTGENARPAAITTRLGCVGTEIGYADECGIADRRRGALWIRVPVKPGTGAPLLDRVHALRQRQAINHLLCRGCGKPTAGGRPDRRHLFFVASEAGQPLTEGEKTTTPPMCDGCALETVLEGPRPRAGYVAALVEYTSPWGVVGIVYSPDILEPLPGDNGHKLSFVAYGDPRLRWTLACREVVSVHGCTAVDLENLTGLSAA